MENNNRKVGGQPGNTNTVKWNEEDALILAEDMLKWMKKVPKKHPKTGITPDHNIYLEQFLFMEAKPSRYPGKIYPNLPSYLAKKFESFDEIYQLCKKIEEVKIKSLATNGKIVPKFAEFILNCNFDYLTKNKQEVDLKSVNILSNDPLSNN